MVADWRSQFPILQTQIGKQSLVYLDNAATTQKPEAVLSAEREFYEQINSNIHRGAHFLSRLATDAHEDARRKISEFLGASSPKEVIFTRGCTEAINLVAQTLAMSGWIQPGDEFLLTTDAHHSNIVPWQMLAARSGAVVRPVPLTDGLTFDLDAFARMLSPQTRLVALPYISNALGVVNPVKKIIEMTRRNNASTFILLDGAQSVAHLKTDIGGLDCDFYAFSGHKVYAPTGTGILWGREELLEKLPPWQGGGEMIREVSFAGTTYNSLPFKYEAGTPNICGNIVLSRALDYVAKIGMEHICTHEMLLTNKLYDGLCDMEGVRVLGPRDNRGALVSIVAEGVHHYDLGMLLDQMGVAVRTGHHCCQPFMQSLGITGTTRYSVALYNTEEEIDRALHCTRRALDMLR